MHGNGRTTSGLPANDTGTPEARVRSAVLTLARLLGRQIAREQHRQASTVNDGTPLKKPGGQGGMT